MSWNTWYRHEAKVQGCFEVICVSPGHLCDWLHLHKTQRLKKKKKRYSKGIWDMPSFCWLMQTLVTIQIHLLSLLDVGPQCFTKQPLLHPTAASWRQHWHSVMISKLFAVGPNTANFAQVPPNPHPFAESSSHWGWLEEKSQLIYCFLIYFFSNPTPLLFSGYCPEISAWPWL